jgi:hypothetical protein
MTAPTVKETIRILKKRPMNTTNFAKERGVSNAAASQLLWRCHELGIVVRQNVGRSVVWSVNIPALAGAILELAADLSLMEDDNLDWTTIKYMSARVTHPDYRSSPAPDWTENSARERAAARRRRLEIDAGEPDDPSYGGANNPNYNRPPAAAPSLADLSRTRRANLADWNTPAPTGYAWKSDFAPMENVPDWGATVPGYPPSKK